jgi:hypothetical protein
MAFKGPKKVLESAMGQVFLTLSMILNLNCIFAKKCNSHGHFEYIRPIKLYQGIVVLVLSLLDNHFVLAQFFFISI